MAANTYTPSDLRAVLASADLSASQWCAMKLDANGKLAVAGANQRHIAGVLVDDPAAANRSGTVLTRGRVKVKAGAAISLADGGTPLTTDASGRFVTATTGQFVHAIAYEAAGAANVLIEVELATRAVAA